MIKEVLEDEFRQSSKEGLVLADFYSTTCGPCKMLAFVLADVDKECGDKVTIMKLDFDKNRALAEEFGITSYPTLILLKDGKEIKRLTGLQNLLETPELNAVCSKLKAQATTRSLPPPSKSASAIWQPLTDMFCDSTRFRQDKRHCDSCLQRRFSSDYICCQRLTHPHSSQSSHRTRRHSPYSGGYSIGKLITVCREPSGTALQYAKRFCPSRTCSGHSFCGQDCAQAHCRFDGE